MHEDRSLVEHRKVLSYQEINFSINMQVNQSCFRVEFRKLLLFPKQAVIFI